MPHSSSVNDGIRSSFGRGVSESACISPYPNVSTFISMYTVADDRCDLLCLDLEKAEALRARRLDLDRAEGAAREAKALSDPTRLALAAALDEGGELCVCDLSWVMERAGNLVSHHMRVLRSEGLVEGRRDGKMVMYSLTETGRALLAAVLERAGATA